jgi:hypothetical protein
MIMVETVDEYGGNAVDASPTLVSVPSLATVYSKVFPVTASTE